MTGDRRPSRVPSWVPPFNLVVRVLLRAGVPMGDLALITIRGRRSGVARTTPVAVASIGGRRWLLSPFGETDWARNLRAARVATLGSGRRAAAVRARELSSEERVAFFRDVLDPYVARHALARWIVRSVDQLDVGDPVAEAESGPVFEVL